MSPDDLLRAVRTLVDLERRDRAQQAAAVLMDQVAVTDLLRAADGAQQVARALAAQRRDEPGTALSSDEHDPHDVRSLYS
jgi:hypothetical protein